MGQAIEIEPWVDLLEVSAPTRIASSDIGQNYFFPVPAGGEDQDIRQWCGKDHQVEDVVLPDGAPTVFCHRKSPALIEVSTSERP